MSINLASVPVGATYGPTGGSATSFKTKRNAGSHVVYLDDGSDLIEQVTAEFSVKEPKANANSPGGYSQSRNQVYFRVPRELADGTYTMDIVDIRINTHRETTNTQKATLREFALHVLADTDFTEFWDENSQA